jgi:hypothetical protein
MINKEPDAVHTLYTLRTCRLPHEHKVSCSGEGNRSDTSGRVCVHKRDSARFNVVKPQNPHCGWAAGGRGGRLEP